MADAISLDGRVALITGAAGGIGAATARLMHSRGARVAIADIDIERAKATAADIGEGAFAIYVDLEDEASIIAMVDAAVAHFGRLDILDNNAAPSNAIGKDDFDVERMDTTLWDRTFSINARATMITCRQALPHLVRSGSGSIINIVSGLALQGNIFKAAYSASKAAMIQLTRSIAASHGRKNVRCNAVAPGLTMTPAAIASLPKPFLDLAAAETLLPRHGSPEDLAQVVAFLASDAARNVTGQLLAADGGVSTHVPGIDGFAKLFNAW